MGNYNSVNLSSVYYIVELGSYSCFLLNHSISGKPPGVEFDSS